jgi:hypothetical protein
MTSSHFDVISRRVGKRYAAAITEDLRTAGFIIVRADAIRYAQAMEREACRYEAANDNVPANRRIYI